MSALEQVTLAALESQAFALMSRLHVLLRRQNGRITDIEYMRVDPAYCRHVLDTAASIGGEDLHQLCARLEEIYFGADGLFVRTAPKQPLLARRGPSPATPAPALPAEQAGGDVDRSYVGRLR
ncbi:MAG TPA: hypothetical protein VIM12_18525 [Noviherbaspirillum sp.]|jgi:hypothetical protein|uniref:hypothetical protein n=1 Tax=Noviherbaspirillum sp. TaxID=1926288 RepID=UPI002F95DC23